MPNNDTYIAQDRLNARMQWRYEVAPHRGAKVQLLTIGGMSVVGTWYGELGEAFLAWAPLLKRDKAREREILDKRRQNETRVRGTGDGQAR
jgi:hypothetical protein